MTPVRTVYIRSDHRKMTNDIIARRHREHLRQIVKIHSLQAAEKLLAALPRRVDKKSLSVERIAELIAEEFESVYC